MNETRTRAVSFGGGSHDLNLYNKWQNEIKASKALEQIIISLQQSIAVLQNKVKLLEKNKESPTNVVRNDVYLTNNEELTEDWVIKKKKKTNNKRKSESSPDNPAKSNR